MPQTPPLIFDAQLARVKYLEACVAFRDETMISLLCDKGYRCIRTAQFPHRGSNGMSVFSLYCDSKASLEIHTLYVTPPSPINWGWVRRWVQSKRAARIATLLNCCRSHENNLPEPDIGRVIARYVAAC